MLLYRVRAASSTEGEKLVPYLIANGAIVDAKDNCGRTPLHINCVRGRIYAVACLVYHGADPNCKTIDTGLTPLQMAAQHGHEEIQKILIAYGATVPEK
jgi:ankyrin repeat protein